VRKGRPTVIPVDSATLDASDFTVNGIPANEVMLSNDNTTITFHFTSSPAGEGVNTMHIAVGAFEFADASGQNG
jgi:hypothetical protein